MGVPFKWGTYSRFGHATLPMHWDMGASGRCLHRKAAPLKWFWWRIVELMFRFQFGLSGDFVPTTRLDHDVFTGGQILSYEFRDLHRAGKVGAQKGAIARFTEKGVVLTDGSEMDVDMVVFGTGFTKSYAYLEPALRERLNRQSDGLSLYRNMFPTQVPDLCFVGSEVSTFNSILTQGLQALWLKQVLIGEVALPSLEAMEKTIAKEQAWKRSWMPKKGDRAAILQLHKMAYHDQLCRDMGVKTLRKGWNLLAELFAPYSAGDYAGLFVETTPEQQSIGAVARVLMTLLTFIVSLLLPEGSLRVVALAGTACAVALAMIVAVRLCRRLSS